MLHENRAEETIPPFLWKLGVELDAVDWNVPVSKSVDLANPPECPRTRALSRRWQTSSLWETRKTNS
ncbi:MAG: hypothetical protein MZV63_30750 [Marinilabiliales bacterium]|nr:hypothetical protein [Marinilabiliales bacterium]